MSRCASHCIGRVLGVGWMDLPTFLRGRLHMGTSGMRALGRQVRGIIGRGVACVVRFVKESRAVSTVEYALIVVAIIAIVGAGAALLGGAFGDLFEDLDEDMNAAAAATETAAEDAVTAD